MLAQRFGNPKTSLPLEVIQRSANGGQEPGRLSLKQHAQNADRSKTELASHLSTASLVQQDRIRMNLHRQGEGGHFPRVKTDG